MRRIKTIERITPIMANLKSIEQRVADLEAFINDLKEKLVRYENPPVVETDAPQVPTIQEFDPNASL